VTQSGEGMTHADRAAYVRTLVRHRCPELTDADLALASAEPNMPTEIGEAISVVLSSMEARLDRLADAVAHTGE
jgi:hypothetical protein